MVKGGHGKGARATDDAGIAFNVTRRSRGKELAFQNRPIGCQPARGEDAATENRRGQCFVLVVTIMAAVG